MNTRHDEGTATVSDDPQTNTADRDPEPQKEGSIQIDEDMAWQRKTWVVQRLGWLAMGGLVLTALTGVFGYGPASWRQTSDPAGLVRLEYERFQRWGSEFTLRVDVAPKATSNDVIALRVNGAFLDAADVRGIVPEPREARSVGSDVEYVFPVAQPGQPATIRFALKLREAGSVSAEVGLGGREPARFTQFVYP